MNNKRNCDWKEAQETNKELNIEGVIPQNLMFFWPRIMNWLYIDYQLDALIIIYS